MTAPVPASRADDLLARMTLEEKVAFVAGEDLWHRPGIERLGIPAQRVTDGPNGARGTSFNGTVRGLCVPCGTALAATWDTDLVEQVGRVLGRETRRRGASVLLGPTVNLHRSPVAGRNFECHSEDPELSARMAVATIRGVQAEGVAATVKHLVANDSEVERNTVSSDVGERAMRELYLRPFEAAVREAGVWAVMSAYNRLNGTYCAEHQWLLTDVLRREWGFDGVVMSDWWGLHATADGLRAGLDLEMPGPPLHRGDRLLAALEVGAADPADLDASVARLLRLAERTGALDDGPGPETTVDEPAERALVRRAASEAMVLLEDRGLLPLTAGDLGLVAVIGEAAATPAVQGGGSAHVTPIRPAGLVDVLRHRLAATGGEVVFEPGARVAGGLPRLDIGHVRTAAGEEGLDVDYRRRAGGREAPAGESDVVLREVVRRPTLRWWGRYAGLLEAGTWTATVRTTFVAPRAGRWILSAQARAALRMTVAGVDADVIDRGEGRMRVVAAFDVAAGDEVPIVLDVEPPLDGGNVDLDIRCQPPDDPDAFERAVDAARRADVAVVVVGLDETWESEGFDRASMALPGRQAELVAAVAAANPRTVVIVNAGSPVELPFADEVGALLYGWYAGEEAAAAWADVLLGDSAPGGRLPTTFPYRAVDAPSGLDAVEAGHLSYGEGVHIGYRWYEARGIPVRYPFGFGRSLTDFVWRRPSLDVTAAAAEGPDADVIATVSVPVRNTGERDGADVVQLYVRDEVASVRRPPKELAGFAKVHLAPGASATARITLRRRAFRFWNPTPRGWTVEPGRFELVVAKDAATPVATLTLDLT